MFFAALRRSLNMVGASRRVSSPRAAAQVCRSGFPINYFTVSLAVVVDFSVPLVPDIVSVKVPRDALLVLMDSFALPDVVTEVGEKVAIAPLGSPETPNFTVPANPLLGETVTV